MVGVMPKQSKGVTLRDIARKCGVGLATVSRALRDPSSQRQETVERIRAAAVELGYDPAVHHAARSMSLARYGKLAVNHLIALFFPAKYYHTLYFNTLFQGLLSALSEQGYGLLTVEITDFLHQKLPSGFSQGIIDGAFICTNPLTFQPVYEKMCALPSFGVRPVVSLLEEGETMSCVRADREGGAYAAVEHLLDLGHTQLACIQGPDTESDHSIPYPDMYRGYQHALQQRGMPPEEHLHLTDIGHCLWELAFNTKELPKLWSMDAICAVKNIPILSYLKEHPEITAILAPNDTSALILYHLLQSRGIRVPEDISLIGFDDTHPLYNAKWQNVLTTVNLPLRQIGHTAAKMMVDKITHPHLGILKKTLRTRLVLRASTAPPRPR